ncbi:MAG: hypothetical protein IKB16_04350 [Lentisphaeria bacterium]|nr:hypothetical protein [Lentisphaeria bacterium]
MNDKRNPNPYKDVDWSKAYQIRSTTHMHCTNGKIMKRYVDMGLELAMFSNYYPSAPYYPMNSICENTFKRKQNGYIRDGVWHHESVDLAGLIDSWKSDLSPDEQAQIPADDGAPLFPEVPADLLEAPNAEHHWFSDASVYLHITAPGSLATSGSFDIQGKFGVQEKGGIQLGAPIPWRKGFEEIFNQLMIPDGGGIVIAHPTWSHHPLSFLEEMLDSDPRVLGIEVYNHNSQVDFSDFSDSLWDAILSTNRQCYGFFVQDHPSFNHPVLANRWRGKIMLLAEDRTAESCLRALRQGRFYGMITDNGLRFEEISYDGHYLRARCNKKVCFQIISKQGVIGDVITGTEFCLEIPEEDKEKHVFLRVTALDGCEEKLFSNAFMLLQN